MRDVTFYHLETGELHARSVIASDDAAVALNTPAGYAAIDQPKDGPRLNPGTHVVRVIDGAPTVVNVEPVDTQPDPLRTRIAIARQLAALEASQHRAVREHLLGHPDALERLKAIDAQIAALRSKL
jgi:hypothetical protein